VRSPARPGLLEREGELAALAELVEAAPRGGRLLAIEGAPGIGKSALIAEAKALGGVAGMRVLGGRGSELERSFSFGVVRQLFEPLLASAPGAERAELLDGAAALAAPLFDPAQLAEPAGDASLAALHGLYWLTAHLASREPLLVAIDDLHWGDLASLRWLAYVLPRMEALAVLVVVGLRPNEPSEDPGLLGQIVSDPLAAVIRPAPLDAAGAARLLRETFSPDADDAFCVACREETGGNPLLLRELGHEIAAEGLAPTVGNVPRLRELAARAGSRAVALRLSRLPPQAAALARAVAVLGDDADPRVAAALAGLDEKVASEAAGALARADVLRPQPPLAFVHPMIGAAVSDALAPLERSAGHARAARLLADAGADPDRVAAHLLRSPPAGDALVVAALRDAARRARPRADQMERACEGIVPPQVFVLTTEVEHEGSTVHSRMFAPGLGITEDPATGAASGPLGCYLVRHGVVGGGASAADITSEQGIEMGRPSYVRISIERQGEEITAVRVGGQCHFMGEGFIEIP
jgi:hypothetical protein